MSLAIRSADMTDIEPMADLLIVACARRATFNPNLWRVSSTASDDISQMLSQVLSGNGPPFRQKWLVAQDSERLVGVSHSILLPVPPIYAGVFGPPGLIMESTCTAADAPAETADILVTVAEEDLRDAGAKILLGSSVSGGTLEPIYEARGYRPLTLYLSRGELRTLGSGNIRSAGPSDIDGIVAASAINRQTLHDLDAFWKPHPDADQRFHAWMSKSLELSDRDMFVSYQNDRLSGYAIAQPSSALHFPTGHDISQIGFLDDWFHKAFADPEDLRTDPYAAALLRSSEKALTGRGFSDALIVCPAAWHSKREVLASEGYETALTWFIKD